MKYFEFFFVFAIFSGKNCKFFILLGCSNDLGTNDRKIESATSLKYPTQYKSDSKPRRITNLYKGKSVAKDDSGNRRLLLRKQKIAHKTII